MAKSLRKTLLLRTWLLLQPLGAVDTWHLMDRTQHVLLDAVVAGNSNERK